MKTIFLSTITICFLSFSLQAGSKEMKSDSPFVKASVELKLDGSFAQTAKKNYGLSAEGISFQEDTTGACDGPVAYFNGVNSLIELDSPLRANINFAIAFSARTLTDQSMGILSHGENADFSSHLHIQLRDGRKAYFGLWGNDITSPEDIDLNWHSFVFNKKSGVSEIWIDGVKVASSSTSEYLGQGDKMMLGKTKFTFWMNMFAFNGYMADFQIFEKSLKAAQIQAIYQSSRCKKQ